MRFVPTIVATVLLAGQAFGAGQPQPAVSQIQANPSAARLAANLGQSVSITDPMATGGLTVYADPVTFDAQICETGGFGSICQTTSSATGSSAGPTLTGVTLPSYIAATGVFAAGTNIPTSTTILSYTGSPGGVGTVTLSATPTGTVASVSLSPPATVIVFPQSGTTTTTATVTGSSQTITLGSNAWCVATMVGGPISITPVTPGQGLGPSGGTFTGLLLGCLSSNKIAVDTPVATIQTGTSQTIAYGPNFTSADIGKSIISGQSAGPGTGGLFTISAVYAPGTIQMSGATAGVFQNQMEHVVYGHDDSTAANAACAYVNGLAIASGAKPILVDLYVPSPMFVPSLSRNCEMTMLRGPGRLIIDDGLRGAGFMPEPAVINASAPQPPAPPRVLIGRRDLPNLAAAGATAAIAEAYDSLATPGPNQLNVGDTYPTLINRAIRTANRQISLTENDAGIGGGTMVWFDGNTNAAAPPCMPTNTSNWLTQLAANCPSNVVVVGGGNNDGTGLSLLGMVDSYLQLKGTTGGAFAGKPMDTVYLTHHAYTRIAGSATVLSEDQDLFAAGYLCSFAQVMGSPCLDGLEEGAEHLWGYSTVRHQLVRAYDAPVGTNALVLPRLTGRLVYGQAATYGKTAAVGATFWPLFTGNSGVTDARGPFIAMALSYDQGQQNWLYLFGLSGGTTIGFECDISGDLPGLGCNNPATGKPPVTPTLQANIAVANSGSGGIAVVTASKAIFQGCAAALAAALPLTVPHAGAGYTPPGLNAYTNAPFVGTISSCDSNTQITLTTAAPRTYTAQAGVVLYGNPVISSGVSDTGDGSGNEAFHVEFDSDHLNIWWNNQNTVIYNDVVVRARSRYVPLTLSGGNRPTLNIAVDPTSGQTTAQYAMPIINQTDLTDAMVNGPSVSGIPANVGYFSPCSGDGTNHNCDGFGQRVIKPLIAAQDWSVRTASGITSVIPTTGTTVTIPADTGIYNVNPAGTLAALTVALPTAGYALNDQIVIPFSQVVTALTITAPGSTVKGAAVSAATINQVLIYKLVAPLTWQRLQ
jgi:hypothetical protein